MAREYLGCIAKYTGSSLIHMNIGYTMSVRLANVIDGISKVTLKKAGFVNKDRIDFLVKGHSCDISEVCRVLGYAFQMNLDTGTRLSAEWAKEEGYLQQGTDVEKEVFGVIYERFSAGRRLSSFGMKHDIKTVLEMPAHGAKAMPSIHSSRFGMCAQKITLINGNPKYIPEWKKTGAAHKIGWAHEDDILQSSSQGRPYDFVWNFAYLPAYPDPDKLVEEMKHISKKYVAVFLVNAGNIGFPARRLVHKKTGIPWIHGDIRYNKRGSIRKRLEEHGSTVVKTSFVDCPVWPDSLGFRGVRLYRMNVDFNTVGWETPYTQMLAQNRFPLRIKLVYLVEKLPMPKKIKSIHPHINYTIVKAEK